MADQVGIKIAYQSAGTAAESVSLTDPVKQVAVENYHATALLYCTVYTGATAAAALALANATDAVAAADETWFIGPGKRKVVLKTTRPTFVALSIIASGAATTCVVEGSMFRD